MKPLSSLPGGPKAAGAIGLSLLIGVMASSLWSCQTSEAEGSQTTTASTAAMRLPVDVLVVNQTASSPEEVVVGTVLPYQEVDIVSEMTRKVVSIHFRDGTLVQKGQLLYKLDDADLQPRLKKVQVELRLAQLNEKRLSELLKTQTVRQQEYDQALTALESLRAEEQILQIDMDKTRLYAPFSGKAGISRVDVGALVTPSTVLTHLQTSRQLKIRFAVPEKYLGIVKEGSSVAFTTDLTTLPRRAVITATEPGLDAQSRSLLAEAVTNNANGLLRAGMTAKVSFTTSPAGTKSISVPTEALIPSAGGYSVFVVKNGKAHAQPVRIDNRSESEALLSDGLKLGDTLVVSNILKASDGLPVQVVSTVNTPNAKR